MRRAFVLAALSSCFLVNTASAVELITNGGFTTGASGEAAGWTLTGLPWVGNNGDWTNGMMPGRSLNLGGYTNANDGASQTVNTAGYATATLTFDFVWEDLDVAGADFFTVSFGGTVLETFDIGASAGNAQGNLYSGPRTYNISSLLNGGNQTLLLAATTNSTAFSSSGVFIDNVSINAQPVPEPATLAMLGLGVVALAKRRKRA